MELSPFSRRSECVDLERESMRWPAVSPYLVSLAAFRCVQGNQQSCVKFQGLGFLLLPDQIAQAKRFQMQATEVLAELLKSTNPQATASKYLDHLSEEFFMVAPLILRWKAKKESNVEVMKKIEKVLEIAMVEKGKTLRPEIQLMNKLLNETDQYERAKNIKSNSLYIMDSDGYFYELLQRMTTDVETLKDSPKKQKLLTQIRTVNREVKEAGKAMRRAK